LFIDFRERIALAMAVAVMLVFWGSASRLWGNHAKIQSKIETLGLHSYALFLMHFPVLLLTNAAFTRFGFTPETSSTATALCWGIAGWAVSLWAANLFYRWIESPAAAWRGLLRLP
jgi:peptidoglycan/LPS O-acetylase OafA/YrhL